jgi:hypothetical protein
MPDKEFRANLAATMDQHAASTDANRPVHFELADPPSTVDPVSVPLPTPTPEREALRELLAEQIKVATKDWDYPLDYYRRCLFADAVMPVVDELRAEIEQLRAYAETTRYHQQKHAEAFRELTATRAERAQIAAALDGYQLVDGDCGQPSGTLVQHVAALREELATTRKELAAARAAQPGTVAEFAEEFSEKVLAHCDSLRLRSRSLAPGGGRLSGLSEAASMARTLAAEHASRQPVSSPVPEEPTPTEHVWDFDLTDPAKNRGVTSCSCGWETDQEETEQDGEILFNSHLVAAVRARIAPASSAVPEEPTPRGPCGDAFEADWMTRVCVKAAGHESFGDAQYRTHCDGHGTTWTHLDSTVDGFGQPKCFDCGEPVSNSEGTTQRRDGQLRTIHIACGRAHILRPAAPSVLPEVQP